MQVKKCCRCNENKLLSCFSKHAKRKDGLNSFCKECNKKYHKVHYEKNKKSYIWKAKEYGKKMCKWFQDLKKEFKCSSCGENHIACLDFHHKDPTTKLFGLSGSPWIYSKKIILSEIKKCICLCANCHRKEHWDKNLSLNEIPT